ncbi:leucyl aminopeptidase [bacterium]|nr:leucyl aminopeptidase [bacterium]MBU1985367.1 leucyl aminopeptidase [bacterium]
MKITAAVGLVKGAPSAIAVCLFDDEIKAPKLPSLDRPTAREVMKLIAASRFSGKKDELVRHYSERGKAPLLILQGLGARRDFRWHTLRLAAGAVVREARDLGGKSLVVISEDKLIEDLSAEEVTRALVDGIILGNWRFDHYRPASKSDRKQLTSVTLYYTTSGRKRAADRSLKRQVILAESTNLARAWGTHPANVVNTDFLAREAKKLTVQGVKVTVLGKREMQRLGMGLILAVTKGSAMPPKLIIMDWNPRGAKKTFALVGKGLVFDSGGLNIKTASMDEMKSDMCGAAAVLGAMHGVAKLKPNCRVVGVIGAVENAIGPEAYRPSDIYTAYNGKTVEILNTDAEGRLVLADAMAYTVEKYKPSVMVDLATLTGAAVVALGHHADAVFSNNERLREQILKSAERAGERMWPMPLYEEYSKEMEGATAELRNACGHRWGGACTAAAFLKEFVGETPWIHIDIAPTAFPAVVSSIQPKETAAGSGVRTLLEFVTA